MTRDEAIEKAISARSDTATKLRMCGDENGDDLKGDEIMRRAYAALHVSLAASGYAVVPVEATEKMLREMCEQDCTNEKCANAGRCVGETRWQRFSDGWAYALAAAQEDSHE